MIINLWSRREVVVNEIFITAYRILLIEAEPSNLSIHFIISMFLFEYISNEWQAKNWYQIDFCV